MAMHSLAMTRVNAMSKATDTRLDDRHMAVLEYAWEYYRQRSVGPMYQNIRRHTGVSRDELEAIFPNGLSSVYTWVGIPIQSKAGGCKPMATVEIDDPREVYFDHNATTPLRPEVVAAMVDFLQDERSFGNPSSAYDIGSQAYDALSQARGRVARCLAVSPGEISFTGSGSEANNFALKGFSRRAGGRGHIVTSAVEHPAVLQTVRYLEQSGHDATYLPVSADGTLTAGQVEAAIRNDTIAVSIMAANNEIGTVYPSAEIGAVCKARGVPFMVDAIQAFGKVPLAPKDMGIDVLTMSGHKIGAPKGVAAIYTDEALALDPLVHGGGQEMGRRAGTENVVGIVALGLAAELACGEMAAETARLLDLRKHFLARLAQVAPGAVINGTLENRLANNLSVGFPGIDSGSVLLSLNQIGVAVSAGSACSAGDDKISHVLEAIGSDATRYGTIRFSFGKPTVREDVDYLFEHLPKLLNQLLDLKAA